MFPQRDTAIPLVDIFNHTHTPFVFKLFATDVQYNCTYFWVKCNYTETARCRIINKIGWLSGVTHMYDLGSRLKEIRLQHGLTQKTLAKRINKSISAVSSYESNAQMPPLDVLISMASVYAVSLDYLVGFSNDPIYSAKGLNPEQKELIELLFLEFANTPAQNRELSPEQVRIIQKLFSIFSSS